MDDITRFRRQYCAALVMLEQSVTACPEDLWTDASFPNPFWRIAYHALYFTHLYLHESMQLFTPWPKHRQNYQHLGRLPFPPHEVPKIGEPYTKEDILEFMAVCRQEIERRLPELDPTAASGFEWLRFDKTELQIYNIRHLQHHTGQLVERLRSARDIGTEWAFG